MNHDNAETTDRARQHLETAQLMGVDFVPVGPTSSATLPTPASPAPAETMPGETTGEDNADALAELRIVHDAECPHCTSVTTHTQTVFGEGSPNARLMFIGEAPGAEEDRTGRPFVGRAGQKLNEMIKAMGLEREDTYIANVLKSRPPDNRTPLQHEVESCATYLAGQIRIIRPAVIVSLGGPATKFLLQTQTGITRLRGQWASWTDPETGREVPVMPTFHPAYLLRNYTPDTRQKMWSDLQAAMTKLPE